MARLARRVDELKEDLDVSLNKHSISEHDDIGEIENKDLLWISYDRNVPQNIKGFSLTFSVDHLGRIKFNTVKTEKPDPSTIWVYLPIKAGYAEKLPYWPHYIDLSPQQRYAYLSWLRNVDEPTDMGNVFLYYYGLERHLLLGDIDKAVTQIIRLRNTHKNKSFFNYSENSIIHACIMRDRLDLLLTLHEKTEVSGFKNIQFLLAYNLGFDLSPENVIWIFYKLYPKSRKAILGDREKIEQFTSDALLNIFGAPTFPIKQVVNIEKIKTTTEVRFCNYSFPDDIRNVEITDFYSSKELLSLIDRVFCLAYDSYKKDAAYLRKLNSSPLSEEELLERQRKRDLNRYKRLLQDKKITQEEFEVLNKYRLSIVFK